MGSRERMGETRMSISITRMPEVKLHLYPEEDAPLNPNCPVLFEGMLVKVIGSVKDNQWVLVATDGINGIGIFGYVSVQEYWLGVARKFNEAFKDDSKKMEL